MVGIISETICPVHCESESRFDNPITLWQIHTNHFTQFIICSSGHISSHKWVIHKVSQKRNTTNSWQ